MRAILLLVLLALNVAAAEPAKKSAREEFVARFQASAKEANRLYPESAKVGSPFYNFMGHFDGWLKHTGDPLYLNPDKPLIVARAVAGWLAAGYRAPARATYSPPPPPAQPSLIFRGYPPPKPADTSGTESLRAVNELNRTNTLNDLREDVRRFELQHRFDR